MLKKLRQFSLCTITSLSLLAASNSWATLDCSWSRTQGTGANATTLAVASNFVTAAKGLVTSCQTSGHCNNTSFTICSDSTANLQTALNSDYSSHSNAFVTYGYFFAADNNAMDYNNYNGTATAYEYAKGIPVFFARRAVLNNINKLITQKSGYAANITDANLSSYSINTTAARSIAVAGTGAPYGMMAHTIINQIEGTSLPGTIPSYVHSPLYGNIGDTFTSVTNGTNKSGFVSKGQICSGIGGATPTYIYVAFTNSNFALHQYAIRLNSNAAATALDSYITYLVSGGTWSSFLASNCYATP